MKRRRMWLLLAGLLLVVATPVSARKWTSTSGKFSVEAELLEVKDGSVRLKKRDGKIVTVPLAKLSKADREHVAALTKAKPLKPVSTREEAIAAFRKLGGFVYLNRKKDVVGVRLINNPNVTDADLKHLRVLDKLELLEIHGPEFSDAGLANLIGLVNLEHLGLYTKNTAAGLKHITALPKLTILELSGKGITDARLVHLAGMTNLEILRLDGAAVTGAGLKHIKGLKNLKLLSLDMTPIRDASLKHIKGMTNLETLHVGHSRITNVGLTHLAGLTNLKSLSLHATKITDRGLRHVKGLTKLNSLYLGYTKITDAGLKHLEGLTNLRELHLQRVKVTSAGLKRLQQALPNCKINRATSDSPVAIGPKRKWTNDRGNFSFEAKLIEIRGNTVLLEKESGTIVSYPISGLSKTDRNYVASVAKAKRRVKPKP